MLAFVKMFQCLDTEVLFNGKRVARFANIEQAALHKLEQLDLAHDHRRHVGKLMLLRRLTTEGREAMTEYGINVDSELLPGLLDLNGQDGLVKLVETVLNQVLEAQVTESLGA